MAGGQKNKKKQSKVLSFEANAGVLGSQVAPVEVVVTSAPSPTALGGSMRLSSDPTHYNPTDPVPSTYHLNSPGQYIYRSEMTGSVGDTVTLNFSNCNPASVSVTLGGLPGAAVTEFHEWVLIV